MITRLPYGRSLQGFIRCQGHRSHLANVQRHVENDTDMLFHCLLCNIILPIWVVQLSIPKWAKHHAVLQGTMADRLILTKRVVVKLTHLEVMCRHTHQMVTIVGFWF